MSPWIQTLHVHDNDGIRDLHQIPYEGVIDWADFARALSETHWNGVLSLEAGGVSRGQRARGGFRISSGAPWRRLPLLWPEISDFLRRRKVWTGKAQEMIIQ